MGEVRVPVRTSYPARVRYRAGVVGERQRVVHVAMTLGCGDFLGLCELRLRATEVEEVSDLAGMPCMVCTRVSAMRSRAPEVVAPQGRTARKPRSGIPTSDGAGMGDR